MGVTASSNLSSVICMEKGEHRVHEARLARSVDSRHSPSALPVMPVLTLPKLPKMTPGKPLDPEQRRELVQLQQQIQVQLAQQRALVESIRQLPEFRDMAPSGSDVLDRSVQDLDSRRWHHVVGPDPVGDAPVDDPDSEGESRSIRSNRENDEKKSNSTLGTTAKAYVDFNDNSPPEAKKDELSSLIECVNGEDTGEPSIQSPKLLAAHGAFDNASDDLGCDEHLISDASKANVSMAPNGSRKTKEEESSAKDVPVRAVGQAPAPRSSSSGSVRLEELVAATTAAVPPLTERQPPTGLKDGFKRTAADNPVAPRRPMPSIAPLKERPHVVMPTLAGTLEPADLAQLGVKPPSREERRWIEAAVRRMFRSLGPASLEGITEAFREWKLQPCTAIVRQQSPVNSGPGLCILFEGVVDVLHKPLGGTANEKVCTYDRCGQCFGELELFYDVPRGARTGRRLHWATIATRTPVTLWTINRDILRGNVPGASRAPPVSAEISDDTKGPISFV